MKFKTKPVIKEAVQFKWGLASVNKMCGLWPEFPEYAEWRQLPELLVLKIKTLEGDMRVNEGDWVIKGLRGEFYSCAPDIFEKTYEPAEREHIESADCWCGPELAGDYESEGGVKHYVHKESQ